MQVSSCTAVGAHPYMLVDAHVPLQVTRRVQKADAYEVNMAALRVRVLCKGRTQLLHLRWYTRKLCQH